MAHHPCFKVGDAILILWACFYVSGVRVFFRLVSNASHLVKEKRVEYVLSGTDQLGSDNSIVLIVLNIRGFRLQLARPPSSGRCTMG